MSKKRLSNKSGKLLGLPPAVRVNITNICCIVCPPVIVFCLFQLSLDAKSDDTLSAGSTQLLGEKKADRPLSKEDGLQVVKRLLDQERPGKLASIIAGMRPSELYEFANGLSERFLSDPEQAAALLAEICENLFETGDQVRAAELTGLFKTQNQVPDIERKLFYSWSENSWDEVGAYFVNTLTSDGYFDNRQIRIAASLALNERGEDLDAFLALVQEIGEDEETSKLQAAMVHALAEQSDPKSSISPELIHLFEANIDSYDVRPSLMEFALRYAPEDPKSSFEWVSDLQFDDKEVRVNTYAALMLDTVMKDLPYAGELLTSQKFVEDFYKGEAYDEKGAFTAEAMSFYDDVLGSFMDGLLTVYPEGVIEAADAFFSETKREEYRTVALESFSGTEDTLHCTNPSCNSGTNCVH